VGEQSEKSYEDSVRQQCFPDFMPKDVLARYYIEKDEEIMAAMLVMLRYTPAYGCGGTC